MDQALPLSDVESSYALPGLGVFWRIRAGWEGGRLGKSVDVRRASSRFLKGSARHGDAPLTMCS